MSKEIPLASPTPSQDKADNEGEPPANPPARNSLVDKLFTAKDVDVCELRFLTSACADF